jgi:cytochrome c-type biogenesis protein CcmH/NrfG
MFRLAVSQRSQIGRRVLSFLFVLIFLLVSGPSISKVQASMSGRILPQVAGHLNAQADEVDTLVQAASELYQQGRFDEAIAKCAKAIALSPNDFRPHGLAGLAWFAQWKMKSASTEFAAVIRLQPQRKEFYVLKAKADISIGAADEAIAGCRKALELDPNFADAYATIGEALEHNEKRQAEAIAAYQSALKIDPKQFAVYDSLGQIFVGLKDEKKAEEVFRQGMAADPKHMSGRFQLGRLLVNQGKLVEARQLWDRRTSDIDRIGPSFINLLTRAENLKRATETLAQKPNDPNALLEMGLAVMDGESWIIDGRQERAIVYFRKALALQPGLVKAQYNIVKAMVQHMDTYGKDKKKLDRELAKLRQLDPALAKEMEEYSKTYEGGLIGAPVKRDQ